MQGNFRFHLYVPLVQPEGGSKIQLQLVCAQVYVCVCVIVCERVCMCVEEIQSEKGCVFEKKFFFATARVRTEVYLWGGVCVCVVGGGGMIPLQLVCAQVCVYVYVRHDNVPL